MAASPKSANGTRPPLPSNVAVNNAATSNSRRNNTIADENNKNVGVLYTGYLEKKNPITGSYKKRFVVLTHEALHWFLRTESDDLFGEERGKIGLGAVISIRILEEDANAFLIETTDKTKRYFRSTSPIMCEEWVSALKSTMKNLGEYQKKKLAFPFRHGHQRTEEEDTNLEVSVLLVSHQSKEREVVLSRNPGWNRIINITNFKANDKLLISTSNGGMLFLSSDLLARRSEGAVDFEVAVQDVTLASSLRMTVQRAFNNNSSSSPTPSSSLSTSSPGKKSTFSNVSAIILSLTSDRSQFIPFFMATMVVFVGLCTIPYLHSQFILFFTFAIIYAGYTMVTMYQQTETQMKQTLDSCDYNLRIHAHGFTSPDAPINPPEEEIIPQRFIDGCEGDLKEARRRWDITRHWRESENLANILNEPQPYFFTIKAMVPHYHFGRGKKGNLVYYERPGDAKLDELAARGISIDDLYRHWLFTTEYQFNVILQGDETAKTIAVLDANGVNMSFFSGDPMIHMKRTLTASNQHYPERSYVIYLVNAPMMVSMMWRLVKPLIHPNTQKKVRILSKAETLSGLMEHIDIENIPEYYGGMAKCTPPTTGTDAATADNGNSAATMNTDVKNDSCRFYGPETIAMNEYVRKLNQNAANAADPFASVKTQQQQGSLPPGKQGDYGPSPPPGTPDASELYNNGNNSNTNSNKKIEAVKAKKHIKGVFTGRPDTDSYSICSDGNSS